MVRGSSVLQLLFLLCATLSSFAQRQQTHQQQVLRGAQQSRHTNTNPPPFPYCDLIEPKRTNFGGLELFRSCGIIDFGTLQSLVPGFDDVDFSCDNLNVTAFPQQEPLVNIASLDMLYFNWKVKERNVQPLEEILNLPDGFHIAKISILRDEKPKYYLSLNFYKVPIAGVETIRSEWSTYVTKGDDPKPRYMVIQVQSSEDTSDPTAPPPAFTLPGVDVSYTIEESGQVHVASPVFEAEFVLPTRGKAQGPKHTWNQANGNKNVFADCQWAEANDALFYVNGIADAALYNGGLFDTPLISIKPQKVTISKNTNPWLPLIADTPSNVFKFQKPLDFAFTPYFNLNDPSFGQPYSEQLKLYRSITFGAFSYGHAFSVFGGLAEPFLRFLVTTDAVPSLFVNFNIHDVTGLDQKLGLPPGFCLAKSRMTPSQPERFLLTLNIYESPDFLTGQSESRAEWSVYVHDTNDPTAIRTYIMVIDVESTTESLDPVNGPTPANRGFEYTRVGDKISAYIPYQGTSKNKFSIDFDMPSPFEKTQTLLKEWIVSNDRVYWANGVYDRLFYNGQVLDPDLAEVDLDTVSIEDGTPFAEFLDATPLQVLAVCNDLQYVVFPWNNVEELCGIPPPPP